MSSSAPWGAPHTQLTSKQAARRKGRRLLQARLRARASILALLSEDRLE